MTTQPDVTIVGKQCAVGSEGSIISTHELRQMWLKYCISIFTTALQTNAMGFKSYMWFCTPTHHTGKSFVYGDYELLEQEAGMRAYEEATFSLAMFLQ